MIYRSKDTDGDYHKAVTGSTFFAWVEKRLMPAFRALYPNKRMFLSMDNASFHRARSPLRPVFSSSSAKAELVEALAQLGVNSIPVRRTVTEMKKTRSGKQKPTKNVVDKQIESTRWLSDKKNGGATREELLTAVNKALAERPELCCPHVYNLLKKYQPQEHKSKDPFHTVIWTPPYHSDYQPIEMCWAQLKQYISSCFSRQRTLKSLREQVLKGFYGDDEREWEGLSPTIIQKCIQHSKKVCISFS
jgi:transposase